VFKSQAASAIEFKAYQFMKTFLDVEALFGTGFKIWHAKCVCKGLALLPRDFTLWNVALVSDKNDGNLKSESGRMQNMGLARQIHHFGGVFGTQNLLPERFHLPNNEQLFQERCAGGAGDAMHLVE
jgi:hypothetical protein